MRTMILLGLTLAAACTSAMSFRAPGAPVLPYYIGPIAVYGHPDSISADHILLGTVESYGTAFNTKEETLIVLMREAREIGANTVLMAGYDTRWGAGSEARQARGTAYYLPPDTIAALDGPSPPP